MSDESERESQREKERESDRERERERESTCKCVCMHACMYASVMQKKKSKRTAPDRNIVERHAGPMFHASPTQGVRVHVRARAHVWTRHQQLCE